MAKLRLNKDSRQVLRDLVDLKVTADPKFNEDADKWEREVHTRHTLFNGMLKGAISAKIIPGHLDILRQYGFTNRTNRVTIVNDDREIYTSFEFLNDEEIEVPNTSSFRNHLLNSTMVLAYQNWKQAERELRDALALQRADLAKRREPYFQLIDNARFYEEVIEVWPEAAEVGDKIRPTGNALAIISETVKSAIAADMERRNVAA